jgi:hypothetical protein
MLIHQLFWIDKVDSGHIYHPKVVNFMNYTSLIIQLQHTFITLIINRVINQRRDLMSKNRAVLVGINYPGTSHPLRGCINDVMMIKDVLTTHLGFNDPNEIRVLLDSQATTTNIVSHLEWLVSGAQPGDVLFFHFSGHGSQVPAGAGSGHEPDGLDEILCPIDLDWRAKVVKDNTLKRIFDQVPAGASLTVLLDCCNSGGALDQHNQYQPLGTAPLSRAGMFLVENEEVLSRHLPMPEELMEEVTRFHLEQRPDHVLARSVQDRGMLITGCQSHQTSADAWIGGRYVGAATHFICQVLREHNYDITYRQLVDKINQQLVEHGFTQRPELNGNVAWFDTKVAKPLGK